MTSTTLCERWLLVFVITSGLITGCGSDFNVQDDAMRRIDTGADTREPLPDGNPAPSEATLCEIEFGRSSRRDVERVLGIADAARETTNRVVLLYAYDDGAMLTLHLDDDVFSAASVYSLAYPQCWAEQEAAIDAEIREAETRREDAEAHDEPAGDQGES